MENNLDPQQSSQVEGNQNSIQSIDTSVFDLPGQDTYGSQVPQQQGFNNPQSQPHSDDFDFYEGTSQSQNAQKVQVPESEMTEEEIDNLDKDSQYPIRKDPEQRAREYQSRYDKLTAEHNKLKNRTTEIESAYNLLAEAAQNPEIRRALIAELDPESQKSFDIDNYVQQQMIKDFGEDFQPDPSQAHIPGPHFRYFEKMKQVYKQVEENGVGQTRTIKQIREQQKLEEERKQVFMQGQLEQIKQINPNISDDEIRSTVQFAEKLTLVDFYKIQRFMNNNIHSGNKRTPFTASIAGGRAPQPGQSPELRNFLSSF